MLDTLGLLIKETTTINERGYFHVYRAVDTGTFKKKRQRRSRRV
jgi:predicted transcriptional regulator